MSSPKVQLIRDLGCGLGAFSTDHPRDDAADARPETPADPQDPDRQEAPAQG